jgi:hypothetical protein
MSKAPPQQEEDTEQTTNNELSDDIRPIAVGIVPLNPLLSKRL